MPKYKFANIARNSTEKRSPTTEDMNTYIGLEHLDSDSIHVTRWGSAVPIKGDKSIMRKGDVLFGKRNAYLRRTAIAPHDGLFSAHGMILRPNENVVNARLFPFFLSSSAFYDQAIRISIGSLSPTINWRDLAELEFNIPPMVDQAALAELLWAFDAAKEAYKRLLSMTDELVKSQFIEMFGDPVMNSMRWGKAPLVDVADIVSGITKGRKTSGEQLFSVPYMRVANVKDGYIDLAEIKTIEATATEIERYQILMDDILMTEGGDPDKLGRGAIWTSPLDCCIHQNHIFRVRLNKKQVNPTYFAEYLRQPIAKEYFLFCAKQTTGIASINMTQLKALPTLLPPLFLQARFADFVRQADKSKFAIQQSLEKLERCRNALMEKAFG